MTSSEQSRNLSLSRVDAAEWRSRPNAASITKDDNSSKKR
jgi:hypothetical protein